MLYIRTAREFGARDNQVVQRDPEEQPDRDSGAEIGSQRR